jgi:hypothetical protein
LVWSIGKKVSKTIQEWKHHLGREIDTCTETVVVAEVLRVFVRAEFLVGEDRTPRGEGAGDLGFEPTKVRKDSSIRVKESQISSNHGIETGGDGRKVDGCPGGSYVLLAGDKI